MRRNWRRRVVLNLDMKRFLLATAGVVALCGLLPAAADAMISELGATTSPLVSPACPKGVPPSQCTIILTRATALETIRDNIAYARPGADQEEIVAAARAANGHEFITGMPEGTVMSSLSRARERLRQALTALMNEDKALSSQ